MPRRDAHSQTRSTPHEAPHGRDLEFESNYSDFQEEGVVRPRWIQIQTLLDEISQKKAR